MISWYSESSAASIGSTHLEVRTRVVETLDQRVDLRRRRVEVGRDASRGLYAEACMCGLRAVMSGAHRDAARVEHLGDVVRVHARQLEGDRSTPRGGIQRPQHSHARHRGQALEGIAGDGLLVRVDGVETDVVEV